MRRHVEVEKRSAQQEQARPALAPLNRARQREFMEMLTQLVHVNNIYSRAPMNAEALDDKAFRGKPGAKAPAPAAAVAKKTRKKAR